MKMKRVLWTRGGRFLFWGEMNVVLGGERGSGFLFLQTYSHVGIDAATVSGVVTARLIVCFGAVVRF